MEDGQTYVLKPAERKKWTKEVADNMTRAGFADIIVNLGAIVEARLLEARGIPGDERGELRFEQGGEGE